MALVKEECVAPLALEELFGFVPSPYPSASLRAGGLG